MPARKEASIETREMIAWTALAIATGLAGMFLFLFLARTKELRRARNSTSPAEARDSLTGLWSRAAIFGVLEAEVARCLRSDASLGILMLDFDHLSKVNEERGRDAGDAVLAEGARRVRNNIRIYDSAGRYGDEEYLLVLPACEEQELENIAERIRMVMERTPVEWRGRRIHGTVSIGGLTTVSLDEKSADRLVRSAARLVAEAKALGRNQVRISEPFEMTDESNLELPLDI